MIAAETPLVRLKALLPFVALLLAGAGASDPDRVGPPPLRLIPYGVIKAPEEQSILPGLIVARATIGRPDAALLGGDLALDRGGVRHNWTRGTVFDATTVSGVPGDPALFCEAVPQDAVDKSLGGRLLFGLAGVTRPARAAPRYCLYDADQDGRFDHALLLGTKGRDEAPFAIPATDYGMIDGAPLGGGSEVRVRYAGPADTPGQIAFDVEIWSSGGMHILPNGRAAIDVRKLPAYGVAAGAVITVLRFDPETNAATIRIDHDLAPGHIVIPDLS